MAKSLKDLMDMLGPEMANNVKEKYKTEKDAFLLNDDDILKVAKYRLENPAKTIEVDLDKI